MPSPPVAMYPQLAKELRLRQAEFQLIPAERKELLQQVASYVHNCVTHGLPAKLTFICTHNSRRSHLSQIWAFIAAKAYGLQGIETFSGGTEATAFNPRAVEALKRTGLLITTENADAANPVYRIRHSDQDAAQECFSKRFDQPPNPTRGYAAIMTCSQADEACPLVIGSDIRVPIRYEDPKVADGTPEEAAVYDERSRQISREMLYLMSRVS